MRVARMIMIKIMIMARDATLLRKPEKVGMGGSSAHSQLPILTVRPNSKIRLKPQKLGVGEGGGSFFMFLLKGGVTNQYLMYEIEIGIEGFLLFLRAVTLMIWFC